METGATGLEPATSGVTGRRSNQLSYAPRASRVQYGTANAPCPGPGLPAVPEPPSGPGIDRVRADAADDVAPDGERVRVRAPDRG